LARHAIPTKETVVQHRSTDTPIFPSTDRAMGRLLKGPLSLLDAKRQLIVRSFLLLTGACFFALGLVQVSGATVVSLMMIIFVVAGSFASTLRGSRAKRIFLDGLRTARAGAAGLAVLNAIFAGVVVFTGPFGLGTSAYLLLKAASYAFQSFALYSLPLEPSEERPLRTQAIPTGSPRVEYERIKDDLVDLDRKEKDLLARKAELEGHPDINRT
jgi:hypothetical protein